jgi:hypothetical protein
MIVIVGLGIYPKPLLDAINPAVQSTNSVVRNHDPVPSHGEFVIYKQRATLTSVATGSTVK